MNPGVDPALQPLDDVDTRILRGIRELYGASDPVPAGLVDDVKFALSVQALHAEVAELQRSEAAETLLRAEYTETSTLTFSAETLTVMVTLTPMSNRSVRVDGWVTGHRGPVDVEVRGASTLTVQTDEDGRFVLDGLPHGPVRFVFHPVEAAANPVITPVVEI